MRRVETPRNWQAQLNAHSDPVTEEHAIVSQIAANDDVPFWQIIYEEGSAWFEYSLAVG